MKKERILLGALLLHSSLAWATSKPIDFDVEFIRNNELTQFKIHTKENESQSVSNKQYRVEVKSENLTRTTEHTSVKSIFQIYEITGKHKTLLMSPALVLIDGLQAMLVSENTINNDRTEFKVTAHMNGDVAS